jgi:PhoPQ-activated pathogenicity-related protein
MLRRTLFLLLLSLALAASERTALDRYVAAPDASYSWRVVNTGRLAGLDYTVLDMVSQTWLTPAEVDRPEWRHWLTVIRPPEAKGSTAVLYIGGGSNSGNPPSTPDPLAAALALQTGMAVAEVRMVPNQPLRFAGESAGRTEDALIAYTWRKFLETGDERWPARLPMTKAAVRAMDAVTEFARSAQGGSLELRRFVVAGGSKRGWTTWTTAAVDRRVVAIAPLVIDALNVEPSFIHHWRAYGFWAPAIQDYVDADLMSWLGTPQFKALMKIEDPYEYRERLSLPKYLVSSTGDQFFLPDSAQFYFNDLPGEKYLRYVPNADHGLNSTETVLNLASWLQAFKNCAPRPRFSWRVDRAAGTLVLNTVDRPDDVLLWQATNPKARDFRTETIGRAYASQAVKGEDGVYTVKVPAPESGFTAFFLELIYLDGEALPLKFTTEVVVTPDVYPFDPPKKPESLISTR